MDDSDGFSRLDRNRVAELAKAHGFRSRGPRTWSRHHGEFVQVVNLQHSQWSRDKSYLNFALWPLALGEPTTFAESKYHFRSRAESMGVQRLDQFFDEANRLATLAELSEALRTRRISGLVRKELAALLG